MRIRKLLNFFLKRGDKKLSNDLNSIIEKFNILDLGAAGGIDKRWDIISTNKKNIFLAEPHPLSREDLKIYNDNVINKLFYKEILNKKKLYLTKKPECSSMLKPNYDYIKDFQNPDRYKIIDELECETTTVDNEFNKISLDFIKIDTQGSEFDILIGAQNKLKNILGLEVECCFFQIYEKQKLFHDISNFLKENDFIFTDFLEIIRWEKNKFSKLGQPQFANVLFLKSFESVLKIYEKENFNEKILNNYIALLTVYNRIDLLIEFSERFKNYKYEKIMKKIIKKVSKRVRKIDQIEHYSSVLKGMLYRK